MNLHEVFNVAYSDLPESVKGAVLKSIAEKVDINEEFICEGEDFSPMVDFVDTISHSEITEEELNEILDLSFESFSGEEVDKIAEEFITLSAKEALFRVMEEVDPAKRAEAAEKSVPGRTQKALDANVSTKRLIKGSDENKKLGIAAQRLKAAQGLVKPTTTPATKDTAMGKLKGAANKVLGAFKGFGKAKTSAEDTAAKAKSWSSKADFFEKIGRKGQADFARSQAAKYQNAGAPKTEPKKDDTPKSKHAHDVAVNLLRKIHPDSKLKEKSEPKKEEAPKAEPKKEEAPKPEVKPAKVEPKKEEAPKVEPKVEPKKEEAPAPQEPAKEEKPKTKKGKAKKKAEPTGQLKLDLGTKEGKKKATKKVKETTEKVAKVTKAPKNVKIDVPKTEETSKDAKAEKKELAKEYAKETSKTKPNEDKVKEIVNKTKEVENKEGFLKQEEKKKAKGEKGTIKLASKIKANKEAKKEAPEAKEPAKAEEAPKVEVKPAKVEAPKKEAKPKAQPKPKAEPKKEEAPKAQPKAETKKEKAPAPQEPAKKEELSKEDRKIQRELDRQAKAKADKEAKDKADAEKELASLEGSTKPRDIQRRDELKAKLNPKSQEEKPKMDDKEKEAIREKVNKNQKRLEELSKIDTPQAKAQVEVIKKYLDKYNKQLNESLVEAMDLLEANLSEESFFEILEMMVTEPKSKADRFKEIMAEKHII